MNPNNWQQFHCFPENDQDEEHQREEEEYSSDFTGGWIQWFCNLESHDFFCEVDEDYIRDAFNLYGLKLMIENFRKAIEMILGIEPPEYENNVKLADLYRDATDLYGLIHARYIISPKGLIQMREKYLDGRFGCCPRVYCNKQRVLPMGISDDIRTHRVRIYCPLCQECFDSQYAQIDGAYIGTSFAAIFLQSYPEVVPLIVPRPFVSKIFGFRVHQKQSIIQIKIDQGEYGLQIQKKYGTHAKRKLLESTNTSSPNSNSTKGSEQHDVQTTVNSQPAMSVVRGIVAL